MKLASTRAEVLNIRLGDLGHYRFGPRREYNLGLSTRTDRCLATTEIRTLRDLAMASPGTLSALPGFGAKCMKEVRDLLYHFDLSLGMSAETLDVWLIHPQGL
jgi:DNA-directed RNA polymerase alpha subunit